MNHKIQNNHVIDTIPLEDDEIEGSVPGRFERVVRYCPDQIAVKDGRTILTYSDLDKASNRIAHVILEHRSDKPEPVALLFKDHIAAIISIFGVLKAGKFYVVLDPSSPKLRLAAILQDVQPGCLLTDTSNYPLAVEVTQNQEPIFNIDGFPDHSSDDTLHLSIPPDALIALFYTSGSTGLPKGVEHTHRTVLHYARGSEEHRVSMTERCSLLASYQFVGSFALYSTLLNGASLYPYDVRNNGVRPLIPWLNEEKITLFSSSMTVFRQFLDLLTGEERFPYLRAIGPVGQALYLHDVEQFQQYFPKECTLGYGFSSTEAIVITGMTISEETELRDRVLPVGYAARDKEILVLNDIGQPLDVNHVGEIAVRSSYLSSGYWRNPELTRQKFLPDPEGGDKRIYLTGDIGRMRPDGRLELVGRQDFQVKIRGYRIELAEIEAAIYELEGVKEVAVVDWADETGDKFLVAYIVPSQYPAPTVNVLRRDLSATLAEYMIPTRFVIMEELPLTPNGKTDRLALPAPGTSRPELEEHFVAPYNPVEKIVVRMWKEVLKLDQVGIHDNFFVLGGHSLLATQVMSRINSAFGLAIPLRSLFETPTIAGLTVTITQTQAETLDSEELEELLCGLED